MVQAVQPACCPASPPRPSIPGASHEPASPLPPLPSPRLPATPTEGMKAAMFLGLFDLGPPGQVSPCRPQPLTQPNVPWGPLVTTPGEDLQRPLPAGEEPLIRWAGGWLGGRDSLGSSKGARSPLPCSPGSCA